jgi:hypothetical protein
MKRLSIAELKAQKGAVATATLETVQGGKSNEYCHVCDICDNTKLVTDQPLNP